MKLFSAHIEDMHTLYISNLKKALDMERKITESLPKLWPGVPRTELKTSGNSTGGQIPSQELPAAAKPQRRRVEGSPPFSSFRTTGGGSFALRSCRVFADFTGDFSCTPAHRQAPPEWTRDSPGGCPSMEQCANCDVLTATDSVAVAVAGRRAPLAE